MKISEFCFHIANILHKFYFSLTSFPLPASNFSLDRLAAIALDFVGGLRRKEQAKIIINALVCCRDLLKARIFQRENWVHGV